MEGDVHVVVEVAANALEGLMLTLFQDKHDITLEHVQDLFSLSFEPNLITSRHASFNHYSKLLPLRDDSLALTMSAVLQVNLAFASAFAALHLCL